MTWKKLILSELNFMALFISAITLSCSAIGVLAFLFSLSNTPSITAIDAKMLNTLYAGGSVVALLLIALAILSLTQSGTFLHGNSPIATPRTIQIRRIDVIGCILSIIIIIAFDWCFRGLFTFRADFCVWGEKLELLIDGEVLVILFISVLTILRQIFYFINPPRTITNQEFADTITEP